MFSPVLWSDVSSKKSLNSRRLFVKGSAVIFASASLVHAQNAQAVNAAVVNRSARMRALSQRLVKLKAQELLQISPDATLDSLVATEKLMSSVIQFLSSSVPVSSRARMETLSRLSSTLLAQSKLKPTLEFLIQSNTMSLELLTAAEELTAEMQALSKVKAVEIVNTAGRQRMLSQRMAKNYFLLANRLDVKDAGTRINADRKSFNDAMKLLGENPLADAKVKQEHANLANRFKKYDELLADTSEKGMSKANLMSIAVISEQVLASANELTVMFEEAVKAKEVGA
jgi:hypothetical protein